MPQKIGNGALESRVGEEVVIFDCDRLPIVGILDSDENKGLDDERRFRVFEGDYNEEEGVKLPPQGNLYEIHDIRYGNPIKVSVLSVNGIPHFRTYVYSP